MGQDKQLSTDINLLNQKTEQLKIHEKIFLMLSREEQIQSLKAELELAQDVVSRVKVLMFMVAARKEAEEKSK